MSARFVIETWPAHSYCLIFVLGYKKLKRQITQLTLDTIPSMYGAMRALKLAKQPGKLFGRPHRNNGKRLWQGLCLLSGDFLLIFWPKTKQFRPSDFIGEWAAGYWFPYPSVPPNEPEQKCATHDNLLLFRSLNKCYWIRGDCLYNSLSISM